MKIYEVQERTSQLTANLLRVWEDSVRATHHFPSDAEVLQIKEYVPQAVGFYEHFGFETYKRTWKVTKNPKGVKQGTQITVPTLVICGTKDMIKEPHTKEIAENIPDSQLNIIKGNHFIANKCPDEFNQAVDEFLKNID